NVSVLAGEDAKRVDNLVAQAPRPRLALVGVDHVLALEEIRHRFVERHVDNIALSVDIAAEEGGERSDDARHRSLELWKRGVVPHWRSRGVPGKEHETAQGRRQEVAEQRRWIVRLIEAEGRDR